MSSAFNQRPQEQPRTHVPCLDWIDASFPRMICTHCHFGSIGEKSGKKTTAVFIIGHTDGTDYVYRIPHSVADALAVWYTRNGIIDGVTLCYTENADNGETHCEISNSGVALPPAASGVTQRWLALNFNTLNYLQKNNSVYVRATSQWPGLGILLFHANTLPDKLDAAARQSGYSEEFFISYKRENTP